MGLLLGGLAYGGSYATLRVSVVLAVGSGILLLAIDLAGRRMSLRDGSGGVMLLKLALLGLADVFPSGRIEWYLAATFIASIGSHMPKAWRHFPVLRRR